MTEVKLLDSSVWIEIFSGGPKLKSCNKELKSASSVVVPAFVLYEVYKKIAKSVSEDQALSVVASMAQYNVVALTQDIALSSADLSLQHGLGMADSFVLGHAISANAVLVTLDNDFSGIQGVRVLR